MQDILVYTDNFRRPWKPADRIRRTARGLAQCIADRRVRLPVAAVYRAAATARRSLSRRSSRIRARMEVPRRRPSEPFVAWAQRARCRATVMARRRRLSARRRSHRSGPGTISLCSTSTRMRPGARRPDVATLVLASLCRRSSCRRCARLNARLRRARMERRARSRPRDPCRVAAAAACETRGAAARRAAQRLSRYHLEAAFRD